MRRRVLAALAALLVFTAARAESVSPTTGLPLSGAPVTPVLLPIGNNVGTVKTGGRQHQAAGVGKGQPWGAQLADIIYESLLYKGRSGSSTRMTFLFHDALVNGVRVDAGPMRSVRETQVLLSREWRAMLVYSGWTGGNARGVPGLRSLAQPHFGLPYESYLGLTGEEKTQLAFDNVIIQEMEYIGTEGPLPAPLESGGGRAILFTAGRVIEGSWRKENADAPTLFVDAGGSPLRLTPGQTYIAQLPVGIGSFSYR